MDSFSTVASERRYHDINGHYQLPNDSNEHERLDAQSQSLVALMNGQPFNAKFTTPPKKIIDVGCGTGSMTNLLAASYPRAQVIGVDISAVPESAEREKASNVEYVQGDIVELIREGKDPRFSPGSFDYVYERLLVIGVVDWPGHIKTVSSLLRPGGWFEAQELDMNMRSPNDEPVSQNWWHTALFQEDVKARGLDPDIVRHLKDHMTTAGLSNIESEVYRAPAVSQKDRPELDGWAKQLRMVFKLVLNKLGSPKRSKEEVAKMEADAQKMFEEAGGDGHFNICTFVGQKV